MRKVLLCLILCLCSSFVLARRHKTVEGKFIYTKTVLVSTSNNSISYIMMRHNKSKIWHIVPILGRADDRVEPYCFVRWGKPISKVTFKNVHLGDYYKIIVLG